MIQLSGRIGDPSQNGFPRPSWHLSGSPQPCFLPGVAKLFGALFFLHMVLSFFMHGTQIILTVLSAWMQVIWCALSLIEWTTKTVGRCHDPTVQELSTFLNLTLSLPNIVSHNTLPGLSCQTLFAVKLV
jgi:hypothetical protein